MDANKSPLALLAKTCSNIGVDTPSLKSLTSSSSSSSSASSSASSSNNDTISTSINHRRSTPKIKSTDHYLLDSSSNKLNFKPYESNSANHHHRSTSKMDDKVISSAKSAPSKVSSPDHQKHSTQPLSYTSLGLPDMHKDSLAAFYKAYGFLGPNCYPTNAAGSPYPSLMPPPIALDKTGTYPSIYPPTPPATAAAALAAYNYSQRLKGLISSSATAPGLCRDPYCGGQCGPLHNSHHPLALLASSASPGSAASIRDSNGVAQSSSAAAAAIASANNNSSPNTTSCTPATCPNGCSQCEHQRYWAALAAVYGNSFAALSNGAAGYGVPQTASAATNSYASSLAAVAALQQHRMAAVAAMATGNVCNWIIGDNHCGKRFNTSEELLQHLKTHTNSESLSNNNTNTNNTSSHSSSTNHNHSPTATSAGGIRSSGTPSPSARVNGSASATSPTPLHHHNNNRYHPYSKPSIPTTAAATTGTSLPLNIPPSPLFGMNGSAAAAAAAAAAAGLPYHLNSQSPFTGAGSLPSAGNFYYPFMTPPNFLTGRIGPPVPP